MRNIFAFGISESESQHSYVKKCVRQSYTIKMLKIEHFSITSWYSAINEMHHGHQQFNNAKKYIHFQIERKLSVFRKADRRRTVQAFASLAWSPFHVVMVTWLPMRGGQPWVTVGENESNTIRG